jgi:NhaP-type Na+/H+ and K+/H+ antiporter
MRAKKFLIIFLGFLIFGGIVNKAEGKVNVGIVSAVKNKVKQLKKKADNDRSQDIVEYTLAPNTKLLNIPVARIDGDNYYFSGSGIGNRHFTTR